MSDWPCIRSCIRDDRVADRVIARPPADVGQGFDLRRLQDILALFSFRELLMIATIPSSTETGSLGVPHLKRMWASAMAAKTGVASDRTREEKLDRQVLNALGLGVHQTMQQLFQSSSTFEEFEAWVVATAGSPDRFCVERLQAAVTGKAPPESVREWLNAIDASDPVLTDEDLSFWEENGYVVLKNAVSRNDRQAAEKVIWDYVEANPEAPDSWYQRGGERHRRGHVHGIMVELIQHPALEINRRSQRIHKAFAQIWGTADLWVSADRCGFHPPQREGYPFPGPDLHWDIDFSQPFNLGTQGILYLTDTPPEQGALTVVPGFHRRISDWVTTLDPGVDPQKEDLHALGSMPIGGQAGDLVIWHRLLPHGSRPNLGNRPRIVQYIEMIPSTSTDLTGSADCDDC